MLYTNMMSTLKVGMVRYGVMCGVDGMVIDDGTVMRLADDRFQAFTTTGGAARILDWMEEWLQTEWPHLKVRLTSVTEQWHTFPVVGPKSRDVVGAVFGELDVSNDAFPFMAWRDTTLDGVHVRVGRVSFSGELAYEVNVIGWYATAVWEKLIAAGEAYGITPYGTETMHVLRAEKGYPIIGQDTDGTITPHDLGMSWAVSKKKPDFIGKRSFTRSENLNPLRKQFVGLLPVDAETVLPEGAQIIEAAADAGTDARARHVELSQRRVGPPVRTGPGQGRARPHRRHPARPGGRNPGARGGYRLRPRRSRRSTPRWLTP
jgi:sarcosine oxidase subunit alpha